MDVAALDALPGDAFVAAAAPWFEGAPRFLARLAADRPFGDAATLFDRAEAIALAMPEDEQLELIDAHPRLGAPPSSVSTASFREQGYDRETTEAIEELGRLNAEYEARFGFRFCVFVAGRPRSALVPVLQGALASDRDSEIRRALRDVVAIARDRFERAAGVPGSEGRPMIEVGPNSYGKSAIRLVKVVRSETPHRVRDLTVAIALQGDFDASYSAGDNSGVIATDTMKNTVYALAGEHLAGPIESFGLALGGHFLAEPQVGLARVSIEEHAWQPIGPAPDAFSRDASSTRTAVVAVTRDGATLDAGIAGLTVMKTTRSAFEGFPRDRFTTLKETDDRIMATKVTASWRYGLSEVDFDASYDAIRSSFLEVFADHHSVSVQASIWIVGKAILERHGEVAEISMSLPNLHHWTVDLGPFGIENDREVYVSTTEPHGLIEATIRRS